MSILIIEKDVICWATGVCGLCPENNKIASFLLINSTKSQKNIDKVQRGGYNKGVEQSAIKNEHCTTTKGGLIWTLK